MMKAAAHVEPSREATPSFSVTRPVLQRKCACGGSGGDCEECQLKEERLQRRATSTAAPATAPPIVHDVLRSSGQPLDATARAYMEPRLGHDFSAVRVHTDATAARSVRAVNALAYTVGRNVVFADGQYAPRTTHGARLLAHELAHVKQQRGAVPSALGVSPAECSLEHQADRIAQRAVDAGTPPIDTPECAHTSPAVMAYRPKDSANFGACDDGGLVESSFSMRRDRENLPWISQVDIAFKDTATDSEGDLFPTGELTATYFGNAHALPTTQLPVAGGKASQGLTDTGGHKVRRIEGCGYNQTSDIPRADRPPGHKRFSRGAQYFKPAKVSQANMSFAVFFLEGAKTGNQAIHEGALNFGSLACVHVDDQPSMRQVNYHSVKGHTKVNVSYDSSTLELLCCERHKARGFMVSNPCGGQDPSKCP